jgi:hypothetical protein
MSQRKFTIKRVKGPLDPGSAGPVRYRTVVRDGKAIRLRVLDADSPNFTAQFQRAFRSNVRAARRENRALTKTD